MIMAQKPVLFAEMAAIMKRARLRGDIRCAGPTRRGRIRVCRFPAPDGTSRRCSPGKPYRTGNSGCEGGREPGPTARGARHSATNIPPARARSGTRRRTPAASAAGSRYTMAPMIAPPTAEADDAHRERNYRRPLHGEHGTRLARLSWMTRAAHGRAADEPRPPTKTSTG